MMFADTIAARCRTSRPRKLRPIAVRVGQGVSFTPDVKTVAEQGFQASDVSSWAGC